MLTIYIDDSGTSPAQRIAVAAGIVIPSARIPRFESEWNRFLERERIPEFHASECLAKNQHSPFASWDDRRVRRVLFTVRQLTIRFSVKAFCTGVHKQDYDDVLTADMKSAVGNSHYSWAVSSVIGHAEDFSKKHNEPITYVFDNADKLIRKEVTEAMEFMNSKEKGRFSGNWIFGKRRYIPGLQAVDLFAWTCYQKFRQARFGAPIRPIAEELNLDYQEGRDGQWRIVESLSRDGIEKWVAENRSNSRTQEIIEFKKNMKR